MESSSQNKDPDNPDIRETDLTSQPQASTASETLTPVTLNKNLEEKPEAEEEDEEALVESLARSKKYCKISNEKRMQLINSVENDGEKIKQAAKTLDINYSSAKSILQVFKKEGRSNKKAFKKRIGKEQLVEEGKEDSTTQLNAPGKIEEQTKPQVIKQDPESQSNIASLSDESQPKDSLTELHDRLLESRLGKRPNPFLQSKDDTKIQNEKTKVGEQENELSKPIKIETSSKGSQTTGEGYERPQMLYMNQFGQVFQAQQQDNQNYGFQQTQQQNSSNYSQQSQPQTNFASNSNSNSTNQNQQSNNNTFQQDQNQRSHGNESYSIYQGGNQPQMKTYVQQNMNSNENQGMNYNYQSSQPNVSYVYVPQNNQVQYYTVSMQNAGQYNNNNNNNNNQQYQYVQSQQQQQQPVFLMQQNSNSQNYSMQAFQIGGNYIPQQNSYIFVGQNQASSSSLDTNKDQNNKIQNQKNEFQNQGMKNDQKK